MFDSDASSDDTITAKELAISLAPVFIGIGLKLVIFRAIGRAARRSLAQMDTIPTSK